VAVDAKAALGALVRRTQRGDQDAQRELRAFADDGGRRRAAAQRSRKARAAGRPSPPVRAARNAPQLQARAAVIRRQVLPVSVPEPRSGVGLDAKAVRHVVELLGLRLPVRFLWADSLGDNAAGLYHRRDGHHVIELHVGLSVGQTNRSALHELVHAAQSEGWDSADDFHEAYVARGDYDANAFEREAYLFSQTFDRDFRVAVTA
jgi:hypothetical protein